jgi:hypothetical protein
MVGLDSESPIHSSHLVSTTVRAIRLHDPQSAVCSPQADRHTSTPFSSPRPQSEVAISDFGPSADRECGVRTADGASEEGTCAISDFGPSADRECGERTADGAFEEGRV